MGWWSRGCRGAGCARFGSLSGLGLLLLVGLLWIPELNRWFFQRVFEVLRWLGVSEFLVRLGLRFFRFWA